MQTKLNLIRKPIQQILLLLPVLFFILFSMSCGQKSDASNNTESELINKVKAVQEQMMKQGNISKEEKQAILSLAALVSSESKSVSNRLLFDEVENVPLFPGCENLAQEATKKCFEESIAKLVNAEFDFDIPKNLKSLESKKVDVFFTVDENGEIGNLKVRKINVEIQAEAIRVLKKIPNMKPAIQNGKKVAVLYSLPIVFDGMN